MTVYLSLLLIEIYIKKTEATVATMAKIDDDDNDEVCQTQFWRANKAPHFTEHSFHSQSIKHKINEATMAAVTNAY